MRSPVPLPSITNLRMTRARHERLQRGLTIADVSKASGIADAELYKVENGRLIPTIRMAKKLAAVLGIEPEKLTEVIELIPALAKATKATKAKSAAGHA